MTISQEKLAYDKIKTAVSKGYIKRGSKLKEVSLSKKSGHEPGHCERCN